MNNSQYARSLINSIYYEANRERIAQHRHERYLRDKGKILERDRNWRKNNPEFIREYYRKYRMTYIKN